MLQYLFLANPNILSTLIVAIPCDITFIELFNDSIIILAVVTRCSNEVRDPWLDTEVLLL